MSGYPDDNPKTVYGQAKPGIADVPPVGILHLGRAMRDGANKYGRMNYRESAVSASVYYEAAMRHLMAYWDGEDNAGDSQVHHLGHVMACCAIILDAESAGMLNDDRPTPGSFADAVSQFTKAVSGFEQAVSGLTNADLSALEERVLRQMALNDTSDWSIFDIEQDHHTDWAVIHSDDETSVMFYADELDGEPVRVTPPEEISTDILAENVGLFVSADPIDALPELTNIYEHLGVWILAEMGQETASEFLFLMDCRAAGRTESLEFLSGLHQFAWRNCFMA